MADSAIITYSCKLYNDFCGRPYYEDLHIAYDLFELLPPLDLEELVIDYLQVKHDYYLCKNSVAKSDTTIKIECELFPRRNDGTLPAVVQVKGGDERVSSDDFVKYIESGKHVFLFFSNEEYDKPRDGITYITKQEILDFTYANLNILPPAIQYWAKMCQR